MAVAEIDAERCIGCGRCRPPCPEGAIVGGLQRLHTVLAPECTGCGLCLPPCPMDCIAIRPRAAWEEASWVPARPPIWEVETSPALPLAPQPPPRYRRLPPPPPPPGLFLPLDDPDTGGHLPIVAVGAHVRPGALLAWPRTERGAPLRAPLGGRVTTLRLPFPSLHPQGRPVRCLVLAPAPSESAAPLGPPLSLADTPAALRARLWEAGLTLPGWPPPAWDGPAADTDTDAPGATAAPAIWLVVTAVTVEPGTATAAALWEAAPAALMEAALLLARAMEAERACLAVPAGTVVPALPTALPTAPPAAPPGETTAPDLTVLEIAAAGPPWPHAALAAALGRPLAEVRRRVRICPAAWAIAAQRAIREGAARLTVPLTVVAADGSLAVGEAPLGYPVRELVAAWGLAADGSVPAHLGGAWSGQALACPTGPLGAGCDALALAPPFASPPPRAATPTTAPAPAPTPTPTTAPAPASTPAPTPAPVLAERPATAALEPPPPGVAAPAPPPVSTPSAAAMRAEIAAALARVQARRNGGAGGA
jgi:NAD-dependent dihydropyrimidine dehydrogenase PreA subunit